ncbi:hypothetical protein JCM33374_g5032 [Metschnikowia sp. JCM 33374]|nr:hypothetical protein JCM33374_g5032 [Metschnikowia sp. JCM 33374]
MSQYSRQQQQQQSSASASASGSVSVIQQQQQQQQQQLQQTQLNTHKRHMQQFYLHKSFDLSSDAEFLPSIPSDPVATAIQVHETMTNTMTGMSPQYMPHTIQRPDQMAFYGQAAQKARRHSGQFLHQHLFGGKRNDYAQYKSGP